MGFLYEQEESDTHTVIRYTRYIPGFLGLVVAYTLAWLVFKSAIAVTVIAAAALVVIFRDQRKVRSVIVDAHKEGRVTRSGHSWSLKNPLTFTVEKSKKSRSSRQGGPRKGVQRTKKNRR